MIGEKESIKREAKMNIKKDIDEVLNEIGLSSIRQIFIQFNTICIILFSTYHTTSSYFTFNVPSWKCNEVTSSNSTSEFCVKYSNRTITQSDSLFQQRCRLARAEWRYVADVKYSIVTEYDLDCDHAYIAALISSSFFVGSFVSAVFVGKLSAVYGRIRVIISFSILCVLVSVTSSYVTSIWQMICLNVIRGVGFAGSFYLTIVYQMEFSPPKHRSILSIISYSSQVLSSLYLAFLANYVRSWRELSTYATLPYIPFLIGFFFLPESPRWLLCIGRKSEAEKILNTLSGRKDFQLEEVRTNEKRKRAYFDLFRNIKVFKITFANLTLWFVIPICFFTIALQAGSFGNNVYTAFALSTAADLPAIIILACICTHIGWKKAVLGGIFLCSILLPITSFIPMCLSYSLVLRSSITMIARCAISVSFCGVYIWSNEIFPTVLRPQGMYLCSAVLKAGCISVPFIIRVLKNWNDKLPFFVVGGLGFVAILVGLLLPETQGKPTRETYDDFFVKKSIELNGNGDWKGMENHGVDIEENKIHKL